MTDTSKNAPKGGPSGAPGSGPENDPEQDAWLVRPSSIRLMIRGSIVALAALVLLDLAIHRHGHFALEESFGFGAWFGFLSCVAMVLFAKGLGMFLKRPDDYYDR